MEEFIGGIWHKTATSLARSNHIDASAQLCDIIKAAPVFFRALGGDPGIQICTAKANMQRGIHRVWQAIAGVSHDFVDAQIDHDKVMLPDTVQCFDRKPLNEDLYWWWLALAPQFLQAGGDWCQRNLTATQQILARYPALQLRYQRLLTAHIEQRKQQLGTRISADEKTLLRVLAESGNAAIGNVAYSDALLPVALWCRFTADSASASKQAYGEDHDVDEEKRSSATDNIKRKAECASNNEHKSPLVVFFRAESILSWAENINLNRSNDDDDDDNLTAADELNQLTVSKDRQARKSRIKFDLDLPSASEDDLVLNEGWTLPEWDYKKQRYIEHACRIVPMQTQIMQPYSQSARHTTISRKLKRQFQALMPQNDIVHRQTDGDEIELDEMIRFVTDRQHTAVDGSRLYQSTRKHQRDLSCLLLADLSRSTETYISNERRIVDVIKESLLLFGDALSSCHDPFEIMGFHSIKRDPVRLYTLKSFDENYGANVSDRINALRPGFYTRTGAAIRAASARLQTQATRQKLLLLLSDGKPNDIDHYEGRFGVEDTRRAIIEARQLGITPFCITIDEKASDYLPYMFGQQHFIVIRKTEQLPTALLQVYRLLTQ